MSSLQSLNRALNVLILLQESEEELGVSEIARRLGEHKSTVHRAVTVLTKKNFLNKNAKNNSYSLGEQTLLMGFTAAKTRPITQISRPYMSFLSQKYDANLFLSIFKDGDLYIISNYMGDSYTSLLSWDQMQSNNTAYRPAVVYCMLAFTSDLAEDAPELNNIRLMENYVLRMSRKRLKHNGPSDVPELVKHLKEIKQNGFAKEDGEYYQDEICYAFPLYNLRGRAFATLSFVSSRNNLISQDEEVILKDLENAAREISALISASETV